MVNNFNQHQDGFESSGQGKSSENEVDSRGTALQNHGTGTLYEREITGSTPSPTLFAALPPHSTPAGSRRTHAERSRHYSHSSLFPEGLGEPSVESSISRPPRPTSPTHSKADIALPRSETVLLQLSTCSLLIFATIWGVLGRLGLEWIGGFGEDQVFALIWPQIVGCGIMGFVVERKVLIESIFPPLFPALGTGFCGSMTTFSSYMVAVFVAFANLDTSSLGRFSGFFSGFAITIVTIGLSIASLNLGSHLSSFLPAHSSSPSTSHAKSPKSLQTRPNTIHHTFSLILGPLLYLGAILLLIFAPQTWRPRATFAIVFGPPGTLLRFFLSRKLNPINPTLPFGTLTANLVAVLLLAISAIFQRDVSTSTLSCQAIQGFQDGFCGSLSTVSTFVVELRGLPRASSYRYFVVSWVAAQCILVLVLGSWVWSGDRGGVCSF